MRTAFAYACAIQVVRMNESEQLIYDELCRVTGRAALMLEGTGQPVTKESILLMLQEHSEQNEDAYLVKIFAIATEMMS
jgi:hypothetical protein